MKVDEWFNQFQCIEIPKVESKWNKKKVGKKQLEYFVSQVESSLTLVEKLLRQFGTLNLSKAWPSLFHMRMTISHDILNFKTQRNIISILALYLKYTSKKEKFTQKENTFINNNNNNNNNNELNFNNNNNLILTFTNNNGNNDNNNNNENNELKNIAESMLEFLSTHQLDPDNSLIGFFAHPNLVELFVQQQKYRKLRAIPSQELFNKFNNFQSSNGNLTSLITTIPVIQNINNNNNNINNSSNLRSSKNYHFIGAHISKNSDQTNTSNNSLTLPNSNNNTNNNNSNGDNSLIEKRASSFRKKKELSVEYLLDLIENWSKLKNRDLGEEVKEFVKSKDKLGIFKGDLVIVKTNTKDSISIPKYMFGRFNGQVCDSFTNSTSKRYSSNQNMEYLSIYINPQESEWIWVPKDEVYKFSKDMMDNLSSSRRIATLIECPSYKLQKLIQVKEIEYLREYLEKNSISPRLLDKLENQTITLRDLRELRSMGLILSQLSNNLPQDLVGNIQRMVSAEVGRFLSQLDPSSIYPPSKREFLERLDKYPVTRPTQLKLHASTLRSQCENTISRLISQKLEILDGSRKIKVVNWWLNLIKDQVDEHLIERGYDPHAVPSDYTQSPPQNIQKVAMNLVVLHNVLPNAGSCDPGILELVKKLKDEIYPVIQDFNQNIKFILYEWLDIPLPPIGNENFNYLDNTNSTCSSSASSSDDNNNNNNSELLKSKTANEVSIFFEYLEKNRSTLSNDNITKIKRMIKDIEYLSEMINLENSISECSLDDDRRYEHHTDIIPISGLIFGRLFRIENELRTVLECWRDPKLSISNFQNLSPRNKNLNNLTFNSNTAMNKSHQPPLINRSNSSSSSNLLIPLTNNDSNNNNNVNCAEETGAACTNAQQQQQHTHSIPEIIIDNCITPTLNENSTITSNIISTSIYTSLNTEDNISTEIISDVNETISTKSLDDIYYDDDIEEEEEYRKPNFPKSISVPNESSSDFIDEACREHQLQIHRQQQQQQSSTRSSSIETVIFTKSSATKYHQVSGSLISSNLLNESIIHDKNLSLLKKSSSGSISTSLPNLSTLTTENGIDLSNDSINIVENLNHSLNYINPKNSPNLSLSTPSPIISQKQSKKKRFWHPFFSNLLSKKIK